MNFWKSIALVASTALIAPASLAHAQDATAVTIVLPAGPDRLDPCETPRSVIGRIIKQNVVETLVELDYANQKTLPRLATSWEQTTPTEWVFKLRPGIAFHDGTPFDAKSVVHSLERTNDPALTCITRTKYLDGIDIKAVEVDSQTVKFTTKTAVPILPTLLAQLTISSVNTPKGEYTAKPIGTGPYTFDHWTQGENVGLVRNDAYWGDKPVIDKATYVWRTESSVAAAMVETGEADLAFSIAPQDATNPETDKVYPNSDSALFRLSVDIPPLNDVRVRKAINLAIDRKAFLGSVISDKAELAMQQVGPSALGFNPNLKPWAYDPEQAQKLLAEAKADGVDVDREIRMIGRPAMFANSNEFVEASAEMLRAVGFNIKLENLEMTQWLKMANKPFSPDRAPNIFLTMHDNNSGDAAFTAFFKYHSNGRQSELHDPALDALIVSAGTKSGDERVKEYNEVFRKIYEDVVADVPLFHMVNYMRVGKRLDFTPTIANAVELQLARLKLADKATD
ncbi:peptide ABC transporter substrate-binding protein [Rhizobiaceae bacterium CRRU44]|uniref:Peptide ABC transporter substrate-binding protein n=1 Tax=Ferranicluibacter rubi TaxID=2715133 RepID=A0AA43ZH59_9HYPH|nr:ABC transporter substrate-binding protein [Ferranicluibacter rubi]NHT76853.1 peptide ABC transporter substrate-binding protein [Ferranicluibacter rubi]